MRKVAAELIEGAKLRNRIEDDKWQRIRYMPGTGLGENGQRVTGSFEHIRTARRAAESGMVLLKNENGLLPFEHGKKIAVFGKAQEDYVKGGGGSGDVNCAYTVSLLSGLREMEKNGYISVYSPLSDYYLSYVNEKRAEGEQPGFIAEPPVPHDLITEARRFTDTAIITICRYSSEGYDRTGTEFDGDFYLSREECAMVSAVEEKFKNIAVVINSGAVIDMKWFAYSNKIDAALMTWQAGMEGGTAAAEILCGIVTPSGHLADTIAERFEDYPGAQSFSESSDFTCYEEGIYVGYRYFETFDDARSRVVYPFGFGLSYTEFKLNDICVSPCIGEGAFNVRLSVLNTGKISGAQVVQVYVEAPQGRLGKPARILAGFRKTPVLSPGESTDLEIKVSRYHMCSYDDTGIIAKSAYVLEKGEYRFHVGVSARDTVCAAYVYSLAKDTVVEQLSECCAPQGDKPTIPDDDLSILPFDGQAPTENPWRRKTMMWLPETGPTLKDVWLGNITLDGFMQLLSDEQKVSLLGGQPNRGPCNTCGFGNIEEFGIPNAMTADGTPGARFWKSTGIDTTAFPVASLMACTWDPELQEEVGYIMGREVRENGAGTLLAPAINIHRLPLCGRNFEYYSEDPYLTGIMASAEIRGIQRNGVAASLKHFACNNREENRRDNDSRLSERALREIYLKAFEICVKSDCPPWTIMTSYNIINGVRSSENKDLITGILRGEWGYEGLVITDWYTHGEQWKEIMAGNDVKMGCGMPEHTLRMLKEGRLGRKETEDSVRRLLELLLKLA